MRSAEGILWYNESKLEDRRRGRYFQSGEDVSQVGHSKGVKELAEISRTLLREASLDLRFSARWFSRRLRNLDTPFMMCAEEF